MNLTLIQKKVLHLSFLLGTLITPGIAQVMIDASTEFTSSNLPIIFIDTDGRQIESATRIEAQMGIIFNGNENRNNVSDPFNDYDGPISIETRGSLAELFPKKSFRLETMDTLGIDQNVSLLGMPSENDWILYAPFIDRSMIRNAFAYGISNDAGRYASRTRFVELVINNRYEGVYVLMEKIKRDNDRVDIARTDENDAAGDSLTGGYIIKIDKISGENIGYWISDKGRQYQYDYPKPDRITEPQMAYIRDFMNTFETLMDSSVYDDPVNGYTTLIDAASFVDHFLLNELFRNIDAYRISTFLYKERDSDGGKLHAGPIWDFNLSGGLAFFGADFGITEGWVVDYNLTHPGDAFQVPFWWEKIAHESNFMALAAQRWSELRTGILNSDTFNDRMDNLLAEVREARVREDLRWNDTISMVINLTYEQDSTIFLKTWFPLRIAWLDQQFGYVTGSLSEEVSLNQPRHPELMQNYPNPFNPVTNIEYSIRAQRAAPQHVNLSVYNLLGQKLATLIDKKQPAGTYTLQWQAADFSSGVYFYKLTSADYSVVKKMVLMK